jgi:hypothetical protein
MFLPIPLRAMARLRAAICRLKLPFIYFSKFVSCRAFFDSRERASYQLNEELRSARQSLSALRY